MKPKPNKNLSLPWTPQGEKASGNHKFSCQLQEKKQRASPISQVNASVNSSSTHPPPRANPRALAFFEKK